jgi:glutamine amidotransferase
MQLLLEDSDEAAGAGIGLIAGRVERLNAPVVPHMGWNDVDTDDDPIFRGIPELVAYYANSYVCTPDDPDTVIARSSYGGQTFAAGVRAANTWGVQFHPEKSSDAGRRLVGNFVREATRIDHERKATDGGGPVPEDDR